MRSQEEPNRLSRFLNDLIPKERGDAGEPSWRLRPFWRWLDRRLSKAQPKATANSMLPVLIKVFAGFSKVAVYRRRRVDPGFAERWQAALEQGYVRIETALVGAAGDVMEGRVPDPETPFPEMTVRDAITILIATGLPCRERLEDLEHAVGSFVQARGFVSSIFLAKIVPSLDDARDMLAASPDGAEQMGYEDEVCHATHPRAPSLSTLGRFQRISTPASPATAEAQKIATLAAVKSAGSGKAWPAMNSDIVKPMPHTQAPP